MRGAAKVREQALRQPAGLT